LQAVEHAPDLPPGKILPIITDDRKALSIPCQEFDFTNPPLDPIQFSSDLVATMLSKNGLGLSSNQVGQPWCVFALRTSPKMTVCFNPRIVDTSSEEVILEEGCLSFPDYFVKIKRPRTIKVRFTYPNGETTTETFTNITARVFQHELDHLNGILFQNRANRFHRDQAGRQYQARIKRIKKLTNEAKGVTNRTSSIISKAHQLGMTPLNSEAA
jgi:peptide deformylase